MSKQNLLTDFFGRAKHKEFGETQGGADNDETVLSHQTDAPSWPCDDISSDRDGEPVQPILRSYPKRIVGSQARCFNASWYIQYPFLEYSEERDLAFCFACRHFSKKDSLFRNGYSNWVNALRDFKYHWKSAEHNFSVEKCSAYKTSKDTGAVTSLLVSKRKEDVLRNRRVLASHIRIILLCAKQEIALRGHEEGPLSRNRGNFLEISAFIKEECPDLARDALRMPKSAQYTHSTIQNELIRICESLVLHKIRDEVQNSPCFAIMADESRDNGGSEQLSVCLRYVRGAEIVERFIGFLRLEKYDAEAIANGIVTLVERGGLNLKRCIAQSYDGASVMSGCASGVKTRIQDSVGGKCPYIHCHSHRLNLALIDSCSSVPEVDDLLGLLKAVYAFQSNSPKRAGYFERAQERLQQTVLKMPQTCDTRWYSKRKGILYFRSRLQASLNALEDIAANGIADEKIHCRGYLHEFRTFTTVLLLVILDKVLGEVNSLSEYLQSSKIAFSKAVELSRATVQTFESMRSDTAFQLIWNEAKSLAESTSISAFDRDLSPEVKRRRTSSRAPSGVLRSTSSRGAECPSVYDSSKKLFFQILDNFASEISNRLLNNDEIYEILTASDPCSETFLSESRIREFCEKFSRFKLNPDLISTQLQVAKNLLLARKLKSARECLDCLLLVEEGFGELILFFKIVLSFPVTSASCERSFSTLRRVKTYLRASMHGERTSALAVLSIEQKLTEEISKDPGQVIDRFSEQKDRRLTFTL